ncbi:MAG: response regulator transcription factor [Anaerolineae bacterium]|nr:response regulator transcription factor [Anaerolineae bacterium]
MRAKILLVEDQNPYLYELSLQAQNGFEFVVIKRGDHAVQAFRQHQPDLVLVDIRLPMLDGIEVIKQIRRLNLQTPIIVITAFTNKTIREQALAAGANSIFPKPTDIPRLYRRIVELLNAVRERPGDKQHIQKMIVNKTRRVQALQERQAMLGISAPPELVLEIEDLKAEIEELERGRNEQ